MTEEICDPSAGWSGKGHTWAFCRGTEDYCVEATLVDVSSTQARLTISRTGEEDDDEIIASGSYKEYTEGEYTWRVYVDGVDKSSMLANVCICYIPPEPPIVGILSASCSMSNGICTVSGRAGTSRAGEYGVYCVYYDDDDVLQLVSELDYRDVDSATEYDFSGSFDNSDPASPTYLIVLIETNTPEGEFEGITQSITPITSTTPAQGEFENVDVPTSVDQGAEIDVTFDVHNTGGEPGSFIVRAYMYNPTTDAYDIQVGDAWSDNSISADETVTGISMTWTAPTTGTSANYELVLSLVT